jgi:mannan endo-1,4-beta-mannosidase
MATSLALALATAAITACGGGSADSQEPTNASATSSLGPVAAGSATSTSSSASSDVAVTTNTSAVAIASGTAGSTDTSGSANASPVTAPSTVTSTTAQTNPDPDAGNTVVASNNDPVTAPVTSGTHVVARPAGNTGTGFYVAGSKLYDSNGQEFRVRGVNRVHWDSPRSARGIPVSGANTERMVVDFTRAAASSFTEVTEALSSKIVPMPSNWGGTCKADPASLSAVVDTWVAQAATWTKLNNTGLINIANEWGPGSTTSTPVPYKANAITPNYTWRDSYIAAIVRMRAAGYTGTLVVDAGSCGQNAETVYRDGAAVLAGDPMHNILFDVHVYGSFYLPATASWQQDYAKSMAALKASGLPIILGEFGPGRQIGPSPTSITPQQIIATAEDAGWGWIPWAWDDNNLNGCQANDGWFSMTVNCGAYTSDADLTIFGKAVVPLIKQGAVTASIFK